MELFRQFALVKGVNIIRDPASMLSRCVCYVEFHAVEHATHALNCSQGLQIDNALLKVAYARENVMHQIIQQVQHRTALYTLHHS